MTTNARFDCQSPAVKAEKKADSDCKRARIQQAVMVKIRQFPQKNDGLAKTGLSKSLSRIIVAARVLRPGTQCLVFEQSLTCINDRHHCRNRSTRPDE